MMPSRTLHPQAQARIQGLLDNLVETGQERGIQMAAYHRGRLVVHAWAGVADPASGRKVDGDTLFPVYSTGKGIAATAVHRLVSQGVLDYDTPIAHYWPQFAAQGKGQITLRHALTHTAGISHMPATGTVADLCDWDGMCAKIAALAPLGPPGTHTSYHAITFSWLIGEPVRRVTGKPFARILEEEICRPLDCPDIYMGIPDPVEGRVATLELLHPQPPSADPGPPDPAIPPWVKPLERFMNRPDLRRACIPASNGIMTAQAIARHYAALLADGAQGVHLLPAQAVRQATTRHRPTDIPAQEPALRFGLGYALFGPAEDAGRAFGHAGYGGSLGLADQAQDLAVGVVKNVLDNPEPVATLLIQELRQILGAA